MRDHWGYGGPIDGVPGPNTWAAVQRLAAAHGYTGPVDGVMGPNSWRGFARFLNQDRWN
jgi:peptidoglycan hydrolase-like protein with peptidoglycan-binding domain